MADCILLGSGGGGFGSDDVTATKNHVLSPYTAITSDSGDEPVAGTIPSVGAGTFYATAGEQTILQAGRYLSGAQKLAKLTATNLSAANILRGKTITINNHLITMITKIFFIFNIIAYNRTTRQGLSHFCSYFFTNITHVSILSYI